jgi:polysaccharide biosynthesis transport protein
LQLNIPDEKGLFKVMASLGYDEEGITKKLTVYRVNNSDFIQIEHESASPYLSSFIVNELTNEFINYYNDVVKEKQVKALNFLDDLVKRKQASMDERVTELKQYKIDNRVLNLNEQAKSLYAQIADYETRKQTAEKEIESNTGALKNIDGKFSPNDRKYLESTLTGINQEILLTKDLIKQTSDDLIKSNYTPTNQRKLDSLKNVLTAQINRLNDKYLVNPLATKQDIVQQKITLEVNLELAKYSVKSISAELDKLNAKFDKLVPHEAVIQSFENAIDIAGKEYIEVLKKLNQTSLESSVTVKLKQIETGMPGIAKPSKKLLLVVLAFAIAFVLCMVVLFVLYYVDDSIQSAKQLANITNTPVLGSINALKGKSITVASLWQTNNNSIAVAYYQKMIRSLRFEIQQAMDGQKTLAITSAHAGEGKTFIAIGVAFAFANMNKKVLLIDGNSSNNTISKQLTVQATIEDYFNANKLLTPAADSNLTVLGNNGQHYSIEELGSTKQLHQLLQQAQQMFDIIIIDTPALTELHKAKEWIALAEKHITVFKYGTTITSAKNDALQYLLQHINGIGLVFNAEKLSTTFIKNNL